MYDSVLYQDQTRSTPHPTHNCSRCEAARWKSQGTQRVDEVQNASFQELILLCTFMGDGIVLTSSEKGKKLQSKMLGATERRPSTILWCESHLEGILAHDIMSRKSQYYRHGM